MTKQHVTHDGRPCPGTCAALQSALENTRASKNEIIKHLRGVNDTLKEALDGDTTTAIAGSLADGEAYGRTAERNRWLRVLNEAWRRSRPDSEARYYLSERLGMERVRELVAEEDNLTSIATDLDDHEIELLVFLFQDHIGKNREKAKFEHAADKITQAVLDWQLRHADFVEATAKKLFPGWPLWGCRPWW